MAWCGAVWCGVVWCGVVWVVGGALWVVCGVVWCGVVWCGVVWCGALMLLGWSGKGAGGGRLRSGGRRVGGGCELLWLSVIAVVDVVWLLLR